jgi:hypothetical protein
MRDVPEFMNFGYLPRMRLSEIILDRYRCRTLYEDYMSRGVYRRRLREILIKIGPRRRTRAAVRRLAGMFGRAGEAR